MIIPDHKKVATIILSRMGKDGAEKSMDAPPEESMEDGKEGLDSAAEEMMMAMHSKSSVDFRKALCSFLDQYEASEGDSDEGEVADSQGAGMGSDSEYEQE
jgi:hypothetical protein